MTIVIDTDLMFWFYLAGLIGLIISTLITNRAKKVYRQAKNRFDDMESDINKAITNNNIEMMRGKEMVESYNSRVTLISKENAKLREKNEMMKERLKNLGQYTDDI